MADFDFVDVIGAREEPFTAQVWVYIPRRGHDALHKACEIDPSVWEGHKTAIAGKLAAMSTGVTVTPEYLGGSMEAEGLEWESVVLAYTYVQDDLFTLERVEALREALYQFGRETRQTRLVVELIERDRSLLLVIDKERYNWPEGPVDE